MGFARGLILGLAGLGTQADVTPLRNDTIDRAEYVVTAWGVLVNNRTSETAVDRLNSDWATVGGDPTFTARN